MTTRFRPSTFRSPRKNCSAKVLVTAMERHAERLKAWWLHLGDTAVNRWPDNTRHQVTEAWDRYTEFRTVLVHTSRLTKVELTDTWETV